MYLILTEDKNREKVHEILLTKLTGYTCWYGDGVWKGCTNQVLKEKSMAILVYNHSLDEEIKPVCRLLCKENDQERIDILNVKNGQVHHVGKV